MQKGLTGLPVCALIGRPNFIHIIAKQICQPALVLGAKILIALETFHGKQTICPCL